MKKIYISPTISTIIIDNEISLILCSNNEDEHGHGHGHHTSEYIIEDNSDSPFYK